MRDRAARQMVLEREVGLAQDEAEASYNRDKLPEAMAAVKRAEGLLSASGRSSAELGRRVQRWRTDLEMAARLDEIRLERSAEKDDTFDHGSADPAYRDAFRGYGLDLEVLDPAEAAGNIRASAVRARLVAALDDWEWTKRWSRLPGADRLLAVARLADPDPWRNRLRDVYGRSDARALAELARDEQAASLPPETVMLLANALKATKQRPLAVEVLLRAQPRHASDFWINSELGRMLRSLRPPREDEAVGFYRAAAALRPEMPGARRNLAYALTMRGNFAQAKAEFQVVINLKPDSAISHAALGDYLARSGDRDGARSALREAIRLKPDSAEVRYYVGNGYRHMGLPDEAIVEYREAIRLKTDYADTHAHAHTHLGLALIAKGLIDEANAEYRAALRLNPDLPEARGNLADNLFSKGLVDEAVAECREAIRRNPGYYHAYYTLGRVAAKKGAWDEAVAKFGRAIELNPKSAMPQAGLAHALGNAGLVEAAVDASRRAIRLKPDYALAHSNLGWALKKMGRLDEAVASYRKAVRLNRQYAGDLSLALNNTAWNLATHPDPKLRDPTRAVELAKEAVALMPNAHWNTLGAAHYRAGEYKAAVAALERSMKVRDGGDSFDWFFLALAHRQLGSTDESRRWYDRAVTWMDRNQPQNEELRRFRAEATELLGVATEVAPAPREKK